MIAVSGRHAVSACTKYLCSLSIAGCRPDVKRYVAIAFGRLIPIIDDNKFDHERRRVTQSGHEAELTHRRWQ